MLYGLCQPKRVLEFIKQFIFYDAGEKKIARYQQYFSVKAIVKKITNVEPGENDRVELFGAPKGVANLFLWCYWLKLLLWNLQ